MVHPGRDVPVDKPNIIPGLILTHFIEVYPLTLENTLIPSGQRLSHKTIGTDLNLPYFS
jgi:hypothetical protein